MSMWHCTYIQSPTEQQMAEYYCVYDIMNPAGILIIHHRLYGDLPAAFTNVPDALTCFGEQNLKELPGTERLAKMLEIGQPVLLMESKVNRRPIPQV